MRNKSLAFITALGLLGCDGGPGSSDIDPAEANLGNQRSGNHLIDKVKVFSGNCDALLVEYQPEKGDETKEASPGWWVGGQVTWTTATTLTAGQRLAVVSNQDLVVKADILFEDSPIGNPAPEQFIWLQSINGDVIIDKNVAVGFGKARSRERRDAAPQTGDGGGNVFAVGHNIVVKGDVRGGNGGNGSPASPDSGVSISGMGGEGGWVTVCATYGDIVVDPSGIVAGGQGGSGGSAIAYRPVVGEKSVYAQAHAGGRGGGVHLEGIFGEMIPNSRLLNEGKIRGGEGGMGGTGSASIQSYPQVVVASGIGGAGGAAGDVTTEFLNPERPGDIRGGAGGQGGNGLAFGRKGADASPPNKVFGSAGDSAHALGGNGAPGGEVRNLGAGEKGAHGAGGYALAEAGAGGLSEAGRPGGSSGIAIALGGMNGVGARTNFGFPVIAGANPPNGSLGGNTAKAEQVGPN